MENEDYILQIKSGDPKAFRKLVEQYQNRMINICYSFLRNREDAEDCAQEVFIQVYRSIADYRGEARLSTWLYRIAVTQSISMIRKKKRKKRRSHIRTILGFKGEIEQIPTLVQDNPEAGLEEQERFKVLQKAIDSLAENQRIAITLSTCEGYSYKEIAEIMGTTVSSVESLIHRAKKNLKNRLERYYKKSL